MLLAGLHPVRDSRSTVSGEPCPGSGGVWVRVSHPCRGGRDSTPCVGWCPVSRLQSDRAVPDGRGRTGPSPVQTSFSFFSEGCPLTPSYSPPAALLLPSYPPATLLRPSCYPPGSSKRRRVLMLCFPKLRLILLPKLKASKGPSATVPLFRSSTRGRGLSPFLSSTPVPPRCLGTVGGDSSPRPPVDLAPAADPEWRAGTACRVGARVVCRGLVFSPVPPLVRGAYVSV